MSNGKKARLSRTFSSDFILLSETRSGGLGHSSEQFFIGDPRTQ
jgi:hypothetical protein